MKIGIIGLPQSGKSSVFSALTGLTAGHVSHAPHKEPRGAVGVVAIPDERLDALSAHLSPKKTTHASITFTDMVGIEKDTALEDMDLTLLKDSDGLICVLRGFEDEAVSHPYNKIDPLADLTILLTEFILLDLQAVQKRIEKIEREIHKGLKDNIKEQELLKKCEALLLKEIPLRQSSFDREQERLMRGFQFVSKQPLVVVVNIDEKKAKEGPSDSFKEFCRNQGLQYMLACAKIEAELMQIEDEELKRSFLADLGLEGQSRQKLIAACASALEQIVFFTTKGDELKAWMVAQGTTAYEAAGKIHSDIQRGFIKAEVVSFKDLSDCGMDMRQARAKAKVHLEGKEHLVHDGDIIDFKFNV